MELNTVAAIKTGDEVTVEIRTGSASKMEEVDIKNDNVNQKSQDQERGVSVNDWKPYESANKELPVTCFIPPVYYKIRWLLVQIFLKRVILDICVGEVIMFFSVLAAAVIPVVVNCCGTSATGRAANIPLLLTFALSNRNSVLTFLFGVPFERALKWHKLMAYFSVASGIFHAIISFRVDVSGIVLISLMGTLLFSSFFLIRRWIFEIFLKLHWVLFIGVGVASVIHDAEVVMIGVGIWGFDIICRCFVLWRNRRNAATIMMTRLPADVVLLSFKKKDFQYMSGQYVFICIPKVSYFEWHPFSISSSPHNDEVYLHVRVLGDWTKQLCEKADSTETTAYIDGPYGQPSVDVDGDKYKIFVFVSGGIGITPMQSICNDLIHKFNRGRPLTKIIFVWCVRDALMVNSLLDYDKQFFGNNISPSLSYSNQATLLPKDPGKNILDVQLYLTRAREPKDYESANIRPELQSRVKFGRPKLNEIFDDVHKFARSAGENKVAVLTCGPERLMEHTLQIVRQFSREGVYFDFHSELFEL